ncbi:hypothetical protein D043_4236A, partial [Vibrio parahaemolyticus EKP-021]
MASAASTV